MVRPICVRRWNVATLNSTSEDSLNGLPLKSATVSERHVIPNRSNREVDLGPEEAPVAIDILIRHHVLERLFLMDPQAFDDSLGLGPDDCDIPLEKMLVDEHHNEKRVAIHDSQL